MLERRYRRRSFWTASRARPRCPYLGLEFAEDFRLPQDIGWGEVDAGEAFGLTMPPHDLMELLHRLHGEALKVLVESGSEAQSSREDAETDQRFQLGYETCNELLAELDPRGGESA